MRGFLAELQPLPYSPRHIDAEGGSDSWSRPPLPKIDVKKDTISNALQIPSKRHHLISIPVFQQIDCEEYIDGINSYIRMFGVTEAGHSVLAQIEGFSPYFYIPAPRGFQTSDTSAFLEYLKVFVPC